MNNLMPDIISLSPHGSKHIGYFIESSDNPNATTYIKVALMYAALDRLDDMLKADDGQAYKEAERFAERIRKFL